MLEFEILRPVAEINRQQIPEVLNCDVLGVEYHLDLVNHQSVYWLGRKINLTLSADQKLQVGDQALV